MSATKYWLSLGSVPIEKTMRTLISWVKQKATPNLKEAKAETMVARPSLMT